MGGGWTQPWVPAALRCGNHYYLAWPDQIFRTGPQSMSETFLRRGLWPFVQIRHHPTMVVTGLAKLAERIVAADAPLTLIDALPGTGKSRLAAEVAARWGVEVKTALAPVLGPQVVDLPPGSMATLADSVGPLVLVANAAQVEGLARWRLYWLVTDIGNAELFLPEAGPGSDEHGGWPALASHAARRTGDTNAVREFLRDTVLSRLSAPVTEVLHALSAASNGLPAADLSDEHARALDWLRPLAVYDAGLWRIAAQGPAAQLRAAFVTEPLRLGTARLLMQVGQPEAAIRGAATAGHRQAALDMLTRGGGVMLGHLHGANAVRGVLAALGPDPDPRVVALRAMSALKAGHIGHAALLLDAAEPPPGVLRHAPGDIGQTELRLVRCLLRIYNDTPLGITAHGEFAALLAEIPPDNHLLRGSVYNIALDDQIRSGRRGEAEATATRALVHYHRAGAPYLAFYIHMHLALMYLTEGRPAEAAPAVDAAAEELTRVPFETPQDVQFVTLLRAQIAYEQGDPEAIAEFAKTAFDGFAYGELWPTIAAQALVFGTEALALLQGAEAARRHLEGWRVQMWRTRRFRLLIEQRKIALLQNVRRWREARQRLEAMATRIGRVWMDSAGENLVDLRDPEDIAQALLWLRQQVLDRPRDPTLAARLSHIAANPALSWRQRLAVDLWRAVVARRHGRVGEARRSLVAALGAADTRGCRGPLVEERSFIAPLLADTRLGLAGRDDIEVPRALRDRPQGPAPRGGLTGQELRALALLAEGCSNKEIAREMNLGLPTVKFHLRNLYRKLAVRDRQSAVAMARSSGFLEA